MSCAILIIDDSATTRRLIRGMIDKSTLFPVCYEAGNGAEGLALLQSTPIDLVLCDLEMPGINGLALLSHLAKDETLREIPVILLTGNTNLEEKIRCLEQGASDYVTKPFHPGELLARIRVQLKIKGLQDSLRESNRELERLSITDPLTGLANRRQLIERLAGELHRCQRSSVPLALIMADIDHFKTINDSYGHQEGDRVLVEIAGLFDRQMRPYDLAARFGGEEFALVLPETTLDNALTVARRLREQVSELRFTAPLARLRVTASFGVAVFPGEKVRSVESLIRAADAALYSAKRNGRNRVEADAQ